MCEDELICDFAETYHILDYRGLSPSLAAILCVGLRDDSRVKMKVSGSKITLTNALMARMVDELAFLSWTKTKDGSKNRNHPNSVLKALTEEKEEVHAYMTPEEFHNAWRRITGENDA